MHTFWCLIQSEGISVSKSCRHQYLRGSVFPRRGNPCHLRSASYLGCYQVSGFNEGSGIRAGPERDGRPRRPGTPGPRHPSRVGEARRLHFVKCSGLCAPPCFLLLGQSRALLSLRLLGGRGNPAGTAAGVGRDLTRGARLNTHARSPAAPSRAGAREHTRALTHARTPAHPAPAPALPWAGTRPPARRQPRLRLPACVYNFVLLPRPPCSWKGGGGMWKKAARRLTGGSSGGLRRRRPERFSFAGVARPLFAVPRARAGLCVLPPRP